MTSKEAVRLAYKQKRAALTLADCQRWAKGLEEAVLAYPQYQAAHTLMAYLAMPKEANLDGVIERALADGKAVYVPVCTSKTEMMAVCLRSMDDLDRGVLHIRQPQRPFDLIEPEDIDLVLVPGLCFDRRGGRMGMGNGYYDRFLKRVRPGHFVATAWSMQISDTIIPMDDHDRPMEGILTENGLIPIDK